MFKNGKYPVVKAQEVCHFITKGTTPKSNEIFSKPFEGAIPYLKVYNLSFDGEMLFFEEPQYVERSVHEGKLSRSKVYPGDVLMNIVGPPLGKFALVNDDFKEWNINQAIAIFRAKDGINPKFLLHALMQPDVLGPFLEKAQGVRQLNFSLEQCRNLEFPLPPMDEQLAFVSFADQSDKSKFARLKSQFIEWFGNLPEESKYDTVDLGDIADMLSGGTPSSKHPEYYGGNIPFVSTPCLGANYISEKNAQNWLTELGVEKSTTHVIPAYSIMYGSRVGVGKCSINTCDMCTNQDILSFFNIDLQRYDLLYIKKVLDQYFDYMDAQKRGSTIKGVPSDLVKGIRIPDVSMDMQKRFAAFTEQSDKSK